MVFSGIRNASGVVSVVEVRIGPDGQQPDAWQSHRVIVRTDIKVQRRLVDPEVQSAAENASRVSIVPLKLIVRGSTLCFVAACAMDLLYGGLGDDYMDGGNGDDSLFGGDGNDLLIGAAGSDALEGEEGDDTLHGLSGNDLLRGGTGKDRLSGGDGDDRLYGDDGMDTLDGDAGCVGLRRNRFDSLYRRKLL